MPERHQTEADPPDKASPYSNSVCGAPEMNRARVLVPRLFCLLAAAMFWAASLPARAATVDEKQPSNERSYRIGFHFWKPGKIYDEAMSGIEDGLKIAKISYERIIVHSDQDEDLAIKNLEMLEFDGSRYHLLAVLGGNANRQKALSPYVRLDQHCVGGGWDCDADAVERGESGVAGATAIETENEFVEIALQVFLAQTGGRRPRSSGWRRRGGSTAAPHGRRSDR